jgi:hypothetical protein
MSRDGPTYLTVILARERPQWRPNVMAILGLPYQPIIMARGGPIFQPVIMARERPQWLPIIMAI